MILKEYKQINLEQNYDGKRKIVECYCRGEANLQAANRPGRYKSIICYKHVEKTIYGAAEDATPQRMVLTSLLESIKLLKEPCEIHFHTHTKTGIEETIKAGQGQGANVDIKEEILIKIKEKRHILCEHVGDMRQAELKNLR